MKPLIGIGTDIKKSEAGLERTVVARAYVEAVRRAGGLPVLLPPMRGEVAELVARLDGIVLTGGKDCDPSLYGQEPLSSLRLMDSSRQAFDLALARLAGQRSLPTLGICLGVQIMSVARGGSLIQDIPTERPDARDHSSPSSSSRTRHEVAIVQGTVVAGVIGSGVVEVNSSHHQAVRDPGEGLIVAARADDGIIEAIEDPAHPFFIGVQWHPEDMPGERGGEALFEALVSAARNLAARRNVSFVPGALAE